MIDLVLFPLHDREMRQVSSMRYRLIEPFWTHEAEILVKCDALCLARHE